jgi:hypothetical protein
LPGVSKLTRLFSKKKKSGLEYEPGSQEISLIKVFCAQRPRLHVPELLANWTDSSRGEFENLAVASHPLQPDSFTFLIQNWLDRFFQPLLSMQQGVSANRH